MAKPFASSDDPGGGYYEIRLTGKLAPHWAGWFDGLTVRDSGDGTTVIAGPIADQAALHGLLQRIHGLGLPLLSVNRISLRAHDQEQELT
jgi:hypothetical protein